MAVHCVQRFAANGSLFSSPRALLTFHPLQSDLSFLRPLPPGAGQALPAVADDGDGDAVSRGLLPAAEQAGPAAAPGLLPGAGHRRPGRRLRQQVGGHGHRVGGGRGGAEYGLLCLIGL